MNYYKLKNIISTINPTEHVVTNNDEEIVIKKDSVTIKITPVQSIETWTSGYVSDNSYIAVEVITSTTTQNYCFYDNNFDDIENLIQNRIDNCQEEEINKTFGLGTR